MAEPATGVQLHQRRLALYKGLPLRSISYYWGLINSYNIPVHLRSPVFRIYARLFNANLAEVSESDLRKYSNLGEFFSRELRRGARPIDGASPLVLPVDGTVLKLGKGSTIEQVKGLTYSVDALLGSCPNVENSLYYAVVYLSPGDYHRFHSPTNWVVQNRKHFVGELFGVAPYFQARIPGLFTVNERVALLGKWKHGFFSMTAVGASGVGSIDIIFDRKLQTNSRLKPTKTCYEESYQDQEQDVMGYGMKKGQQMGGFKLGSTVVLIFDAPEKFQFLVSENQRVRVGEPLGLIRQD